MDTISVQTIQNVKGNIIAKAKEVAEQLEKSSGVSKVSKVLRIAETVIQFVETTSKAFHLSSEAKTQIAVDTINAVVDIPAVPEFIEENMIRTVVVFIVSIYNKLIWKRG